MFVLEAEECHQLFRVRDSLSWLGCDLALIWVGVATRRYIIGFSAGVPWDHVSIGFFKTHPAVCQSFSGAWNHNQQRRIFKR